MTSRAVPPLLISSANIDNNTTQTLITDSVNSETISDGQAYLNGGFLNDLNDPVAVSDAATKNYVDTFSGGGGTPGGVSGDIQINDGASDFTGSNNFTFTTGTTDVVGDITNGTITISGTAIDGVADPVSDQDAATKNYVDNNSGSLGQVEIDAAVIGGEGAAVDLTPAQVYNNVITTVSLL